eukprot:m.68707 g.68707  ORF g.68707 m.68707 type:complete len:51 (-) comp8253_c5_seq1:283-435(-)
MVVAAVVGDEEKNTTLGETAAVAVVVGAVAAAAVAGAAVAVGAVAAVALL